MPQVKSRSVPLRGRDFIALAQQLARDAERHAILSASLASQADRLIVASLRLLAPSRPTPTKDPRLRPSPSISHQPSAISHPRCRILGMRARFSAAVALAAAGVLSISCGGIVDPSKNQVETFSGTINPGTGAATYHPFSSSKTGEISVKLTALAPASSVFLGVVWAQDPSNGSCTGNLNFLQQNNFAQLNLPAISGQIISGKYCIAVYESAASPLSASENYTVTVSHP